MKSGACLYVTFVCVYVCVCVCVCVGRVKVKVKFTLEQATKTLRGIKGITLLFL